MARNSGATALRDCAHERPNPRIGKSPVCLPEALHSTSQRTVLSERRIHAHNRIESGRPPRKLKVSAHLDIRRITLTQLSNERAKTGGFHINIEWFA